MKKSTAKKENPVSKTLKQKSSDTLSFPIVGIGASAGGLEALEEFFGNMPENSGLAYVVIQHLDPNHAGIMPELLQRTTQMKVVQDPSSGKFDGMPQSAVNVVIVDILAPANQLPEKLIAFLKHTPEIVPKTEIDDKSKRNLEKIVILLRAQTGHVLRAWVNGCSTGEEAYSLAIVFKEAYEKVKQEKNLTLQIFAADIDSDAIERGRKGVFSANIAPDVSPERLSQFFVKEDDGFRVNTAIREMVVFAPQNVIKDPPFTKMDLLFCRNLLIYIKSKLQKKLMNLFHYALNA